MPEKTCNGGYCNYKTFGGSNPSCNYTGYCDYQTPKDGRTQMINPSCTCGLTAICQLHNQAYLKEIQNAREND